VTQATNGNGNGRNYYAELQAAIIALIVAMVTVLVHCGK
jgi:hypothetical protein